MSMIESLKHNDFAHVRIVTPEGQRYTVLRALCQHCGDHADAKLSGGKNTLTQEWAERLLRSKISLGRDRQHDTCFKCIEAEKERRAAAKEAEAAPTSETAPDSGEPTATPAPSTPLTPKFRHSKYSDAELAMIIEMVHAHKNPKKGNPYVSGWTDRRIADELRGVIPQITHKHVMYIRQVQFGVAFSKPSIAAKKLTKLQAVQPKKLTGTLFDQRLKPPETPLEKIMKAPPGLMDPIPAPAGTMQERVKNLETVVSNIVNQSIAANPSIAPQLEAIKKALHEEIEALDEDLSRVEKRLDRVEMELGITTEHK